MRIVIALGGNALLPKGARGTAKGQLAAARAALGKLSRLMDDHQVALTHGNGPQVGSLLLQQHATKRVPEMPLDVLDAMTQGEIGYFMQSALHRKSAVLLTRALVDEKDPAFSHPTKPIGPFYGRIQRGMHMVMDAGRGYRLVVPSPEPLAILEKDAILSLMRSKFVVICGGGGGIPVNKAGHGVAAVIDKDRFSSLLASSVHADLLVFITSVDAVYADFGKKSQKAIAKADARAMKRMMAHFAEGSMRPKVESAVRFLEKGGKKVVICSIGNVARAIKGKAGTTIVR
ncbi:MAG: carbamate kinase [Candidatus ainarchaeum sp.]|nr:carbamate kinase [Candidatus ainarchaeum sp.]